MNDVLHVATWNIWWRYGQWRTRDAAVRATLNHIAPDVVALNEVWEEVGGESQAEQLSRELGYHVVSHCPPKQAGLGSGNALLSRWPIRRSDILMLGSTRCVLYAEFDSPHGALSVFVTHLTWRPDDSGRRQEQLGEVLKFVRDNHRAELPPILMGDLNAEPDSDELRMLTGRMAVPVRSLVFVDLWEQVGDRSAGYTWDRANRYNAGEPWSSRRLDYVLVGLPTITPVTAWVVPLRCRLAGVTAVDGVQASDHYAVTAELRCMHTANKHNQQMRRSGVDHVAFS